MYLKKLPAINKKNSKASFTIAFKNFHATTYEILTCSKTIFNPLMNFYTLLTCKLQQCMTKAGML